MEKGYLHLADGQLFEGTLHGAPLDGVAGELVFTTVMTGYLETVTDPSFFGQMVVQTFPLVGNYGFIPADLEGDRSFLSAYVVNRLCGQPSNFRSTGPFENWLRKAGVPCLAGVDTRLLTQTVREDGVMNAFLSASARLTDAENAALRGYRVGGAVEAVTCGATTLQGDSGPLVALYDFGVKRSMVEALLKRGCRVAALPAHTPAAEALALRPDGILFSNGPGDPVDNTAVIRTIRHLLGSGVPLFGICLGHQLMALAAGGRTRKMRYGHRGANQPAQNRETGRTYITSQNHGYCVIGESLPPTASVLYQNANDGTCEGVRYRDFAGFSVQFHPEAHAGPSDTGFLFDEFIHMMGEVNANAL